MALAAYSYSPANALPAASRAGEVESPPLEGLKARTLAEASRYAKEAAAAALAALLAGDTPLAQQYLKRAKRWEAYALKMQA